MESSITRTEATEEIRKVQVTGKSTFIISLPKSWVTRMKVKPGDQVLVKRQSDGSILVKLRGEVEEMPREAKFRIARGELPETLARRIVSAYLAGYSLIHSEAVEGPMSPQQKDAVKEIVRKILVGTEIVDESSNHMTLQVLLRTPEFDVRSALRRMTLITSSMHRDALQALKSLNLEVAREVIKADDDVDRFNLYIIRQLKAALESERVMAEMGLKSPSQCLGYRVITKSVERVADHAVKIAENVLTLKDRPPKRLFDEILKMSELATASFEASIDSLFKEDYQLAEDVVLKSKKVVSMESRLSALLTDTGEPERSSLRLILEDIKRTAEYASDIAEIALNRTIERLVTG